MQTLILPGYHLKNKDWADKIKIELDPFFPTVVINWKHWKSDKPEKNWVEKESAKILHGEPGKVVNIIAKSIGTLVASYVVGTMPEFVNKIILCGIPLNDIDQKEKENYINLKKIPSENILAFQNSEDPHANFDQVKTFLEAINENIKIIKKPRADHEYYYLNEFVDFLK